MSQARLTQLVDIVFEKVRQRTHGADDEGKTVRKIFRHFDLDGFGTIEMREFKQSLETLGCVFKEAEVTALFSKFDKDSNGKLDYEEFANAFAIKGSGSNPNVNPVFSSEREKPNQVLDKVKQLLLKRGAHGIRGLGLIFRRMDNNGDKKLDRYEFQWGLKETGHDVTPSEFERVFKYFDKNNNGQINYDEFLVALRGDLNQRRQNLVDMAFAKLDRTNDGVVTVADLVDTYNVEFHPKFKSGEMSKKDILQDFMKQWDGANQDGKVEKWEFRDYYRDVSASIDDDDYFELSIRNAWHLAGGEGKCANTSIPRELVVSANGDQKVQMQKGHGDF